MPCTTVELTQASKAKRAEALRRLEAKLQTGAASVVIDRATGALAFKGWSGADRDTWADVCAYRALQQSNSAALRRAVAAAEARYGRAVDARAVAAGVHSHDGGATWGKH